MTNLEMINQAISMHEKKEVLSYHFENNTLLTFQEWKKRGYTVMKGEKAILKCEIWKRTRNKKYKEGNGEKQYIYFKKVASFFSLEQVKEI